MGRCQHIKSHGQSCRAHATSGSAYCFFHDPATREERTAAQRAGGQANRATIAHGVPRRELKNSSDVAGLLAETINNVRRGELDPKVANCVGYLSTILLKSLEQSEIADRLEALERIMPAGPPSASSVDVADLSHLVVGRAV